MKHIRTLFVLFFILMGVACTPNVEEASVTLVDEGSNPNFVSSKRVSTPSLKPPTTLLELEARLLNHLNLGTLGELDDYLDSLTDDAFIALMQTVTGLNSSEEAETLLDRLDDEVEYDDDIAFGTTVTDMVQVSNGKLSIHLEFMDQVRLPNGQHAPWSDALKQPYIDAADQWLDALVGIEGKDKHTITIQVSVDSLVDANGIAGPSDSEMIGQFELPIQGELLIGNHTYEDGFDQVEFKATILHEMGHIFGVGTFTETFIIDDPSTDGLAFQGPTSNQGAKYYNQIYNTSVDFVPMSDDGGHLYDAVYQEDDTRRLADGSALPSLTQEFMASGHTFGSVTLGVLDDIGYIVDYTAAETYTP